MPKDLLLFILLKLLKYSIHSKSNLIKTLLKKKPFLINYLNTLLLPP
jgi:hypothetical protein